MIKPNVYLCIIVPLAGCTAEPEASPSLRDRSGLISEFEREAAEAEAGSPDVIDELELEPGQIATFLEFPPLQKGTGPIDDDAPQEFSATESGLQYRILRNSAGTKPTISNSVTVNYRGWLDNGKKFDGSYNRRPSTFSLDGVIDGWTEGLQLVGTGGMIELWVPPELGYGAAGFGARIPPNATLHFVVELQDVH